MEDKNKKTAYIALIIGVVSGSFSSPLLRYILQAGVSEQASTFYRIFFAAIALSPYELLKKKRREIVHCFKDRKTMLRLVGLGFLKAGTLVTQAFALMSLEAFSFNTIYYLNPLMVMVLSFFLLKEKTSVGGIIGAIISISGVVVATLEQMNMTGVLFALLSAAFYAGYIVLGRDMRGKLSASVSVYIPMCISSVAMLAMCLIMGVELSGFDMTTWLLLIALGLVCTLLSQSMPMWAVGYLSSTTCSLFSLFSLILAAGIAYLMLGEAPTLRMIIGAVILCFGMAVYLIMEKKYHRKKEC